METKSKTKSVFTCCLLGILVLGIAFSGVVSVLSLQKVSAIGETVTAAVGDPNQETQENDVCIAGQYYIRDTSAIAEAFQSGDTSNLDDKQKETLDMTKAILEEIITDNMTPYEMEDAVYVWMTENLGHDEGLLPVIPTTSADCDNPYGVLKYHNAVCVGYATTFRLFMQELDIPCMVVHNTDAYHSWDLVQLDDAWYHVDIYSDAGTASYANFNLNDAMRGEGQEWDRDFFPAADSLEYNHAYRNKVMLDGAYDIAAQMKTLLDEGKTATRYFGFTGGIDDHGAQIVNELMNQIQNRMDNGELEVSGWMYWSFTNVGDGEFLLNVTLELYSEDEPSDELTPDDLDEITQTIVDVFGESMYTEDPGDIEWTEENTDCDDCGL